MSLQRVDIYTDGSCSGNPGHGGWGALMLYGESSRELYGSAENTTNNRMELTAAIMALEVLKRSCDVQIHTDSIYLRDGVVRWLAIWEANGWRTASRRRVKNVDLWQRLRDALKRHRVRWVWVRAHSGNAGNERADALARKGTEAITDPGA